jgi:methylated-DNA-[protein]-cysteine S-methyltransferase
MLASASSALIASPLGLMECAFDNAGRLTVLRFTTPDAPEVPAVQGGAAVRLRAGAHESLSAAAQEEAAALARQLGEYFTGTRRSFDIALAPRGTAFQLAVWDELLRIPFGTTLSYGELARRVDLRLGPTAAAAGGLVAAEQPGGSLRSRAVGRANALNPLAIIVPCHRVVGSRGELTGYAGGLWRKQALLQLEGALPAQLFRS